MMSEPIKRPNTLIVEDRKKLTLTGVCDIDSFDEGQINLFTDTGNMTIIGRGLHINRLAVDLGELTVDGDIIAIEYKTVQPKGSLIAKLFK